MIEEQEEEASAELRQQIKELAPEIDTAELSADATTEPGRRRQNERSPPDQTKATKRRTVARHQGR